LLDGSTEAVFLIPEEDFHPRIFLFPQPSKTCGFVSPMMQYQAGRDGG